MRARKVPGLPSVQRDVVGIRSTGVCERASERERAENESAGYRMREGEEILSGVWDDGKERLLRIHHFCFRLVSVAPGATCAS